jgi:hypothetical protein
LSQRPGLVTRAHETCIIGRVPSDAVSVAGEHRRWQRVRRLVARWSAGVEFLVWGDSAWRNTFTRVTLGTLAGSALALAVLAAPDRMGPGATRLNALGVLVICLAYFIGVGLFGAWAKEHKLTRPVGKCRHSRNPKL